jgi:MFS family permease
VVDADPFPEDQSVSTSAPQPDFPRPFAEPPDGAGETHHPDPEPDRFGLLLTLLVAFTALPVVALVVPNTISYVVPRAVDDLGLRGAQAADLVRANGLVLPATLLAVPLCAVLARRFPAWVILMAGLLCLLGGELTAQYAASVPLVAVARSAQGLGAGAVLPATLVLVWRRAGRALSAVWAGIFVASLLLTMPLALYGVPRAPGQWRSVLQPYPWLVGAALATTGLFGIFRGRVAASERTAVRPTERTQLLLLVAPAAGFAFLAVVTTYGWSPGAQLVVAGIGLAALLGLALVGTRDLTTGSPLGCAVVMISTGLLTVPVVSPLAGLMSTREGPQAISLLPFAAGAFAALAGALLVGVSGARHRPAADGEEPRPGLGLSTVLAGHGLAVVAVLILLTTDAGSSPWLLCVPLVALGGGIGMALAASLRSAELGSALFGLALCFPAVLLGFLVIGPLQVARVNAVVRVGGGMQNAVYALTAGFRVWLIVAGVIAVLLAGAAALAGRGRRGEA